jgi:hypothetical protein
MQAQATSSSGSIWLKRVALILAGALVIAGLYYLGKALMSGGSTHKKAVTTVKLLPDTPPPPPPPPKEPPKEQPKEVKEVKEIQQPKPDPSPPAEVLKMEGAAGDGPSPFAAGAVNSEYKGGDVGTKIGGRKGLAAFAWFTGQVKVKVEEALAADKDLSVAQYRLVVLLWLNTAGHIERIELQGTSNNDKTDAQIKKVLTGKLVANEPPPSDMPQPIKIRITSKNSGL